jgi:1-acyl-sn-glycerol-3-phosphate acyltransferase
MNPLALFVQLFTGVQARWMGCGPEAKQRIYFANHTSHFDFLILWAVLPPRLREKTTAAGAADYWTKGPLRRWLCEKVFKVALIERQHVTRKNNPITQLTAILDEGKSLIIFPEGTRSADDQLHDFKPGIYHLAKSRPNVDLVPAFIDNANRVLPKGEFLPVPLICSVTFGTPMRLEPAEHKEDFLERARLSVQECAHL